jgi:hypothetical protein
MSMRTYRTIWSISSATVSAFTPWCRAERFMSGKSANMGMNVVTERTKMRLAPKRL